MPTCCSVCGGSSVLYTLGARGLDAKASMSYIVQNFPQVSSWIYSYKLQKRHAFFFPNFSVNLFLLIEVLILCAQKGEINLMDLKLSRSTLQLAAPPLCLLDVLRCIFFFFFFSLIVTSASSWHPTLWGITACWSSEQVTVLCSNESNESNTALMQSLFACFF